MIIDMEIIIFNEDNLIEHYKLKDLTPYKCEKIKEKYDHLGMAKGLIFVPKGTKENDN